MHNNNYLPVLKVNGKKRGTVLVPVELTEPQNDSKLKTEVMCKAREERVLDDCVTVTKVIVASRGNLVNFLTTSR